MEDTMIDSESTGEQEVVTTEPTVDNSENQGDVWAEEFDVNDEPKEEVVKATEPVEESTEAEYVTEGLGDLDKPIVIKYKGKTFDIANMDQIRDLMERGMGATQKLQELAEMRKELHKEQNPDMTEQELSNIDTSVEVESIAQKIANSKYVDAFKGIVETLPDDVTDKLRSDPRMLEGLRVDTESGLAQKIIPLAERYMAIEGLSFMEAYIKGGNEVNQSAKSRSQSIDKLTAVPKSTGNVEVKQKDVWDISDSEFRSLMDSERR